MAAQLCTITLITMKYRTLFGRLGVQVSAGDDGAGVCSPPLIGIVLPFGGPVGLVQFVKDLGRQRVRSATVLTGSLMATIVNEIAFFLFLIPAVAWLAIAGRVTTMMAIGLLTLGTIVAVVLTFLLTMIFRGSVPPWLASRLPDRIMTSIDDIQSHQFGLRDILAGIPFALGVNFAGFLMLAASLQAVGQHASMTTLLVARVAASLAILALPVFQGAGAVEVTVIGALHAGGVPVADAIAATLLFRIGQFWAPLMIGGAAITAVGALRSAVVATIPLTCDEGHRDRGDDGAARGADWVAA